MTKSYKATIAIDFDGTITNFSTFPVMGTVRNDIPEFLYKLRIAGYRLVLNTCRTGEYFKEAVDCLKDNGLYDLFDWKTLKTLSTSVNMERCLQAFTLTTAHVLKTSTAWTLLSLPTL